MMRRRFTRSAPIAAVLVGVLALGLPGAALAAPTTGRYAAWTITAASSSEQNHSGTIAFGVLGMPDATYTVTKTQDDGQGTSLRTAASSGDWLTAATPFGAIFGASNNPTSSQFLNTRIDYSGFPPAGSVATTDITFASPVPANALGFVTGDIDVDVAGIDATDGNSVALTGAQLNGSTFNFCDVASDVPTSCAGVVAPFDLPTWNSGSRQVIGTNAGETEGASAMFQPTTTIRTLSIEFSGQTGSGAPSYRLWLAVRAANVSGTVDYGNCPTQEATVELVAPDGVTVIATTTAAADGSYDFGRVVAQAGYEIRVSAPTNCQPVGEAEKPADTTTTDQVVDFTLEETPTTTTATGEDLTAGGTEIANTGSGSGVEAIVGGSMVLLGALCIFLARRRRSVPT